MGHTGARSRQYAYQDAAGNVNLSALAWLREREGGKFVRVTNAHGSLDEVVPLDELPEKEPRDGPGGAYIFIDPEDLRGPDFAQVGDDVPF
ncbi:hypothetical protein [Paracoccus sp. (in: a-proteobacteria)]|uniref:hypothetical protein n=1 Tax=Paracoccus sp. TaxID=267 RepID=UPI003A8A66D3